MITTSAHDLEAVRNGALKEKCEMVARLVVANYEARVRNDALEEAARVVDDNHEVLSNADGRERYLAKRRYGDRTATAYAAAIRALKVTP